MSETSNAEGAPAVAAQRVVSRPHPWKNAGANYLKLKEAKRIANLRRAKKRNTESPYFAKMVWRTAKHRQRHPEEPNEQRRSANAEPSERAKKT